MHSTTQHNNHKTRYEPICLGVTSFSRFHTPRGGWRSRKLYCHNVLFSHQSVSRLSINNIFNTYFSTLYTRESVEDMPSLEYKYHGPTVSGVNIIAEIIMKTLTKLHAYKAPGLDWIQPSVLKEVAFCYHWVSSSLNHSARSDFPPPGDLIATCQTTRKEADDMLVII